MYIKRTSIKWFVAVNCAQLFLLLVDYCAQGVAVRVEAEGVTVEYNGEPVLENVDLILEGPGLVQILGPNGAGKTTLLKTLLGLVRPVRGRVRIEGVDVTGRPELAGRYAGYVPQRPPLSKTNPITVYEFVASRLLFGKPWPRLSSRSVRGRVKEVLEAVGVPRGIWGKRLWELSGGQLMRTFIARTLVHEPRVLFLDEPLAPVDPRGKRELARLLGELARDRLVVVTSHDPMLLLDKTRTVVLVLKRIIAYGPPREVLRVEYLREVYGESVIPVREHVHIADEHWGGGRGA